ncbi:MAG TPA: anaerobic sulfatase maturase [Thermotogota bacterium]|nr:anaerobic sulfatase maturase [Thermotogota bacterium]
MRLSSNRTFSVMAKVVGAHCNLQCDYCYYTEKAKLLAQSQRLMSDDVLEAYIIQNLHINGKNATVEFAWHGGEPLLAGLEFFQKAMAWEKQHGQGRRIINTLQTNATLIDDEWCRFFAEHDFLLGISIDGPEPLHDAYRKNATGGSFDCVMNGIERLKKWNVRFNTLTAVHAANENHPEAVYNLLRKHTNDMQFLPVVERKPDFLEIENGQHFATPPGSNSPHTPHDMAPFSVSPEGYGHFMISVFERWQVLDKGKKHIQLFEVTAGNLQGIPSSLCVHNPLCGHGASVEVDGSVYACDHYAFEEYCLGNIMETPLEEIMERNRPFGMYKTYGLCKECFDCPYLKLCFGGCPKDRVRISCEDGGRINYLCDGYKIFFSHILDNLDSLM